MQFASFRKGLTTSRQETVDEVSYIIKNSETGQFYRFGELEFFIIEQLNGKNSSSTICQKVSEKYKSHLTEATLEAFITSLSNRSLLAIETSTKQQPLKQKQLRFKGNWLSLRFSFFDPDRLLSYLIVKLRFLFTSYFIYSSVILVISACFILLTNYAEIQWEIINQLSSASLIDIWVVIIVTVIAHEFAHGLTCKHFGGEVREIGFLLLFCMPAFFCNVSDAWLFTHKSKRLWVAFSGAYCEFLIWALAVIGWRIFAIETSLHYFALILIASSGFRILLNFNPLIKLDGYYMLSDYLDIPNLRAKALDYLKIRMKALISFSKMPEITASSKEKYIFLFYGFFASIFSIFILSYLASLLAHFLVDQLQGTGFIIFIGILMIIFYGKIKGLWLRFSNYFSRFNQSGLSGKKPLLYVSLIFILAFILLYKIELTVPGEFEIYPAHNADIRAEVEAIIDEIYVNEGDKVKKGDKLAHLSDREYKLQLSKVEAEIREHEAQLKMLTLGATKEEITSVRSKLKTAKTRYEHVLKTDKEASQIHERHLVKVRNTLNNAQEQLEFAEKKLQRIDILSGKKLVSQVTLENTQEDVSIKLNKLREVEAELRMVQAYQHADIRKELAVSQNEVEQAEADLNKVLAGTRPEQIESIEAVINALLVQQQYLQSDLERVNIVSPIDGVVITPKIKEKVGQLIKKGDLVLEVYQYDMAKIEMLIPEKEIGEIREGQSVEIKARAFPDKLFHGLVVAIAPTAMDDKSGLQRKVVRVTTEINNLALSLKPEMTGHAKIYCGERSVIELISRRLVRYLKVEFWSWW